MLKIKYPINIKKTNFPMRGNLLKLEIEILNKWKKDNIYKKIREKFKDKLEFILHDGPPYANGPIHIGHAVNKILKDFIIKSNCMLGYNAKYIPGWDCHGMPIEIQIEKKFGKNISIKKVLTEARKYAEKQIKKQKLDFIRLGIIGDWKNIYKTMNFKNEAEELRIFRKLLKNGYIYHGLKPVYWCFDCKSALAEAEIEYKIKKCISLYVGFPFFEHIKLAKLFNLKKLSTKNGFIIIWTTTPWSLISNQALSLNPNLNYSLIEIKIKKKILIILAEDLIENFLRKINLNGKIISTIKGKKLKLINFKHPFYKFDNFFNRLSPIFLDKNITKDNGTGIVHLAPAYGVEDYNLCKKNNIKDFNILDFITDSGNFKINISFLKKKNIWESIDIICLKLKESESLFKIEKFKHKYMYCWRHNTPVIYKTTLQWFASMDILIKNNKKTLREKAISSIKNITFFPKKGKNIFKNMIINRPDWTLSRQRQWGVPIALFYHYKTGELHPKTDKILKKIANKIEKYGIEIWHKIDLQKIINEKNSIKYIKSKDTLDVWFDSGTTHKTVLRGSHKKYLKFPSDICVEGIDQFRGWFNTSLLTSLMLDNKIPYKSLLVHGFVVDKNGKKMSKSNGNVISPKDIIDTYGAEILRLWVASVNYSNELSISKDILNRVIEIYRRIRNTIRFLLSNIEDFDNKKDSILIEKMLEIDKYAIIKLNILQKNILKYYSLYKFYLIIHNIQKYCSEELGSFYLDIIKDRLYTNAINSLSRRSAQTAIWHITKTILCLISPILSFTADEAWNYFNNKKENKETIFIETYHVLPKILNSKEILKKFLILKKIKNNIIKKIEENRISKKIGSTLEVKVKLKVKKKKYFLLKSFGKDLKFAFIISSIKIEKILDKEKESIEINLSKYKKCERCWHYCKNVGLNNKHKTLCKRCIINLFKKGEKRLFI
ncbi:isoleucine--tRNA ligase [Candidatus Zinderia endosymbiont of Aphrophora alni]|uniref:isoleucine--tRNA ligase n=1 Tax=Candidatus Zinderia endosymbiont of Aphrophora alni TaxID=3077951 RepID=UPI0030D25734